MSMQSVKHSIFAALLILLAVTTSQAASWQWIAPQRMHSMVKEGSGLWIVDVRTPNAFELGHIEGAMNIPADVIKVKNLPKGKIIVLADDSLGLKNARSGADILVKKGFEKVFILEGGITAWQGETLPFAGKRNDNLRPVMWDELVWARSINLPLRMYDLRDKQERTKGPVEGARELPGATLGERLKALTTDLRTTSSAKGLAGKLEKPLTTVLVLPSSPSPVETVRQALRDIPGDIRYLEGAYPLWAAREKQNPLPGPEVCPTCPAGRLKK